MFNAAQEQFGGNPFAALVNNAGAPAGSANPQAGQENRAPLPNPWSGSPSTQFVIHFFGGRANSYELIHRHLLLAHNLLGLLDPVLKRGLLVGLAVRQALLLECPAWQGWLIHQECSRLCSRWSKIPN